MPNCLGGRTSLGTSSQDRRVDEARGLGRSQDHEQFPLQPQDTIMSSVSRGARAVARPLRQQFQRTPRRHASDHGSHGHGAGHGESAFHVQQGPANESFGVSTRSSCTTTGVMDTDQACRGVSTFQSPPFRSSTSSTQWLRRPKTTWFHG